MEKRNYVKPILNSEAFVPQTYVAACGDVNVTWTIGCNVPYGFGFIDTNSNGKYDRRTETKIATGSGCEEDHTGVTLPQGQKPTANALWQETDYSGNYIGDPIPVFYWQEGESYGTHSSHHFSLVSEGDWHKENLS